MQNPCVGRFFESKLINISVCLCISISNSKLFKITCMTPLCSPYIPLINITLHHQNQPDLDAYISKFIGHAWTIYKQGVESYSKWGETEILYFTVPHGFPWSPRGVLT